MKTLKELQQSGGLNGLGNIRRSQGHTTIIMYLENELLIDKYGHTWDFDIYLPTYDINLQRPYVWTLLQQEELIWSMILGRQIPPIVVVVHEHSIYRVIDGKQRVLTIKRFLNNEFPIHIGGEEIFYKDLGDDIKYQINARNSIEGVIYYSYDDEPITEQQLIALFNFYNFAGTPQEAAHRETLLQLQQK